MSKHTVQIQGDDGCIYIYDNDTKKLSKLCDINAPDTLPENIIETIKSFKFEVIYPKAVYSGL